MKLYTEEQVIKAIDEARFTINGDQRYSKDEILDSLTPIELPSDEDIKEKVELILSYDKNREEEEAVSAGFALGAKWVISHVKQQENGN